MVHYIHLNPVRAKVVPAERVLEFRWSSLPMFAAKSRPAALEAATVLRESGELSDTPAGWTRYVNYLGVLAEEDAHRRKTKFGRMIRGWAIGSAEFKAELKKEMRENGAAAERFELLGADSIANRELRAELGEDKLAAVARALEIDLNAMPAEKSARGKVRLAAVMETTSSVSNRWLAERLQMGAPASVSQYMRRFRLSGEANQPAFKRALSRVTP